MHHFEHTAYQFFKQQESLFPCEDVSPTSECGNGKWVAQQGKHNPSLTHSILGESKMKIRQC